MASIRKGERLIDQAKIALPELGDDLDAHLKLIGPDYTDEDSGFIAYSAYGDTVFNFLREALRANRDQDARRVFLLTEELAASNDVYAQSVVATEIAQQLVNVGLNDQARPLMGPATQELLKGQEELVDRADNKRNRFFRLIERLVRSR